MWIRKNGPYFVSVYVTAGPAATGVFCVNLAVCLMAWDIAEKRHTKRTALFLVISAVAATTVGDAQRSANDIKITQFLGKDGETPNSLTEKRDWITGLKEDNVEKSCWSRREVNSPFNFRGRPPRPPPIKIKRNMWIAL